MVNILMSKTTLVIFYSEGQPNDAALDLSANYQMVRDAAEDEVDAIEAYTPSRLKAEGYGDFVKEYDNEGLVRNNPGMSKIGFCAWRPLILLLQLNKVNDGDVVAYRDCNISKYPKLADYDDFAKITRNLLGLCGFDIFVPHHHSAIQNSALTKTNVLRELGEDHPFSYSAPALTANLIVLRKSPVSIQFLNEWLEACQNEEWINGEQYGDLTSDFSHSTSEQALMNVILANWIRNRTHNIPYLFPRVYLQGSRDIHRIYLYQDLSHLGLLDQVRYKLAPPKIYQLELSMRGLLKYISDFALFFLAKKKYQLIKFIKKFYKSDNLRFEYIKLKNRIGKA